MNAAEQKQALRAELAKRWQELWPASGHLGRPPNFPGAGRAAERLRRLAAYRTVATLAVTPEPGLLQVRVNALMDNKALLAATPGLKQGLVRLASTDVPLAERSRALAGGSLFKAGRPLRLPGDRPGRLGLLVVTALAADRQGRLLGDGRGLVDLLYALLRRLGALAAATPVAALLADEQVLDSPLPAEPWDLAADLLVTPSGVLRAEPTRPRNGLADLPPGLARLPLVQAALSLKDS